jgi:hypothetical protein
MTYIRFTYLFQVFFRQFWCGSSNVRPFLRRWKAGRHDNVISCVVWAISKRASVAVFLAFPPQLMPHGIPKTLIDLSVSVDAEDFDDYGKRIDKLYYIHDHKDRLPCLSTCIYRHDQKIDCKTGNFIPQHRTPECSPLGTKGTTVSFKQSEAPKSETHN